MMHGMPQQLTCPSELESKCCKLQCNHASSWTSIMHVHDVKLYPDADTDANTTMLQQACDLTAAL